MTLELKIKYVNTGWYELEKRPEDMKSEYADYFILLEDLGKSIENINLDKDNPIKVSYGNISESQKKFTNHYLKMFY